MAKDIRECLLEQAEKFHQWQEITYPGKTTGEIGGMWEVDYPAWNDIFDAFCHVLTQMDAEMADSFLLDEMVYLIARANEAEGFIQETTSHPKWFEWAHFLVSCPVRPTVSRKCRRTMNETEIMTFIGLSSG